MRKKAFTLIELLVVISIIGLLMAILLPSLRQARNQAKMVICQTRLKQMGLAFKLYTDDNKDLFFSDYTQWWEGGTDNRMWKYYQNESLRLCPMAQDIIAGNHVGGKVASWAWGSPRFVCGYALNEYVLSPPSGATSYDGCPVGYFWKSPTVKGVSNTPLITDGSLWGGHPLHTNEPPRYDDEPPAHGSGQFNEMLRFCIDRHNGGINIAFLDWSVRKVGLKQLWRVKWHREFDISAPLPVWPEWMSRFKES